MLWFVVVCKQSINNTKILLHIHHLPAPFCRKSSKAGLSSAIWHNSDICLIEKNIFLASINFKYNILKFIF